MEDHSKRREQRQAWGTSALHRFWPEPGHGAMRSNPTFCCNLINASQLPPAWCEIKSVEGPHQVLRLWLPSPPCMCSAPNVLPSTKWLFFLFSNTENTSAIFGYWTSEKRITHKNSLCEPAGWQTIANRLNRFFLAEMFLMFSLMKAMEQNVSRSCTHLFSSALLCPKNRTSLPVMMQEPPTQTLRVMLRAGRQQNDFCVVFPALRTCQSDKCNSDVPARW